AGDDVPRHLAVHDDGRAGDLCVHHRALADRQRVLRGYLALDLALDATRPVEHDFASDFASLAEERARHPCIHRLRLVPLLEHPPPPVARSRPWYSEGVIGVRWQSHEGFVTTGAAQKCPPVPTGVSLLTAHRCSGIKGLRRSSWHGTRTLRRP